MCWAPLGYGLLAGTIRAESRFGDDPERDIRAGVPRMQPDALAANVAFVDLVRSWARRKEVMPAQLALAWLLAQNPLVVPMPGTTKAAHLDQNVAAAAVTFTVDELREFNGSLAAIEVQGERLPPEILEMSGVEAPPKA